MGCFGYGDNCVCCHACSIATAGLKRCCASGLRLPHSFRVRGECHCYEMPYVFYFRRRSAMCFAFFSHSRYACAGFFYEIASLHQIC